LIEKASHPASGSLGDFWASLSLHCVDLTDKIPTHCRHPGGLIGSIGAGPLPLSGVAIAIISSGRCILAARHIFLVPVFSVGLCALSFGQTTITTHGTTSHGSSSPTHTTTISHSNQTTNGTHTSTTSHRDTRSERDRERRERAWRDWYYRYRHVMRPGYIYPPSYPPGYNDSEPSSSSSPTIYSPGGDQTPVDTSKPGNSTNTAANGKGKPDTTLFGNTPANSNSNSNSTPQDVGTNSNSTNATAAGTEVDPELQAILDRVKKACSSRADYQTAVADKKEAEDQLSALRANGDETTFAQAAPLATRVLNDKKIIAMIEREETAKDTKAVEAQPSQVPPALAPFK
jgi:hypothetical protein